LLASDEKEAEPLALKLDGHNGERQQIQRRIADEAIGAIKAKFNPEVDYVIVEGQLLWHIGVVGIVASRVLREFYRPTIIIGGEGQEWRGSGRSIDGFDIAMALRSCSELLIRHGGHAMAAGLSIHCDNVDKLRLRLNAIARQTIRPEDLRPALHIDAATKLAELSLDQVNAFGQLEPLGQQNPAVNLLAHGLSCKRPPHRIGREQQHLKLCVTDGISTMDAVWWNSKEQPQPEGKFDLVFVPQINEWKSRRLVQLKILDWKPTG
jgi:single-stranded-DNA-specific exonuclease